MYLSFDLGGKPDEATNFKSVIKINMSRREVFLLITEIIKRRDCFKFKNNTPINQMLEFGVQYSINSCNFFYCTQIKYYL